MSNSPGSAAARIQAQQRQMSGKDMKCENCGSEHMYEVQATRYLSGGSGSVEILQDTNEQVFPLLKCAGCNYPVLPKPATGRRHGGVYESSHKEFRASVEKGQAYIKSLNPETVKADILQKTAGQHVEAAVAELKGRLATLETSLGEPVKHKEKDKAKANDAPATV